MQTLGYRPSLDGIRGIAIALVVSVHAFGWPRGGYLGVDLFFVLSGFLITTLLLEEHAERSRISLGAFYERRARRLLPALLAMLAVYAAVEAAGGRSPWSPVLQGLFYCTNIAVAFFGQASPISHLWSLGAEEQFYLLWPILLIGLLRRPRWLGPVLAGCLIIGWLEGLALTAHGAALDRVKFAPDTRSLGLIAGCLFAVWRYQGVKLRSSWLLAGLPVIGLALSVESWSRARELLLPFVVLAFAVLVHQAAGEGIVARLLSWRPLVWLGGISYSLYLWHDPSLGAFGEGSWLRAAGAVGAAIIIAALSTRYVERPFRRGRRRKESALVPAPA